MAQYTQTDTSPSNVITPGYGNSSIYFYTGQVWLRTWNGNDILIGPTMAATASNTLPIGTTSGSILRYNGSAWVEDITFNTQPTTLLVTKSSSINMNVVNGANNNYVLIQNSNVIEHIQSSATDIYNRQITSHGYTLTTTDGTNSSTHTVNNEELSVILADSNTSRSIANITNYYTGFSASTTDNTDGTYLTEIDATIGGTALLIATVFGASTNIDYESRVQATPTNEGVHLLWHRTDNNTVSDDEASLDLSGNTMVQLYSRRHTINTDPIEQEFSMTIYNDASESSFDITGEIDETFRARIYAEKGYISISAYEINGANIGDAIFVANTDGGSNIASSAADCSSVSISVNNAVHQNGVLNSVALGMYNATVSKSGTVYTGGRVLNSTTVNDNYLITSYDNLILFSGTSAGKTLTLPNSPEIGRQYIIANRNISNSVNIASSLETINGTVSPYTLSLNSKIIAIFDGLTDWMII